MSEKNLAKRTAIHQQLQDLGGEYITARGWETPIEYSINKNNLPNYELPDHVSDSGLTGVEHLHTREAVNLTSLPYNAPIEIAGPSATEFVQRMFSNDMEFGVGQSKYAMMLNENGGVLGDIVVSRIENERYFAFSLAGANSESNTEWLSSHSPENVSIKNFDDCYGCIGVYGPNSLGVVNDLVDADLSRDGLRFYGCEEVEVDGIPTLALRLSYVGEFGWEFWTPSGYEAKLWDSLWAACQGEGGSVFGVGALLSMGIEKGYHVMGADLGPEYTPFEAGLGRFVDMDTNFIGKDAMDESVDRERVCITMDDPSISPEAGDEIYEASDMIGQVSRSGFGYSVGDRIIYAYLPTEYATPGTSIEIHHADKSQSATVQDGPLFDPTDSRLK